MNMKLNCYVCLIFALLALCGSGANQDLEEIIRSGKWENLPPVIISPTDGAEMILIPAGEFSMGAPANSPLAEKLTDAVPERAVYLDAYYIDKYEVTNEQYMKYVEATGSKPPIFIADDNYNDPAQPVVGINLNDASTYALWRGKRLPTEAEWEKAARGVDRRIYPWGDSFDSSYCNSSAEKLKKPVSIGKYPEGASPYGVMDMAGNVSEWVSDGYASDYYSKSPYKNPRGPTENVAARVIRGGDYNSDPVYVSSVARVQVGEYAAFPNIGMRCVASLSELEKMFAASGSAPEGAPLVTGITVISKERSPQNTLSDSRSSQLIPAESDAAFKKVRYFKNLDFDGLRCVGRQEIHRARRAGAPYWKVYFHSPGVIVQAQYYDKREYLQFHIEPVYDSFGKETQVKLYDNKGFLVYRSERIFEKGRPVKGVLYSATGDFLGEEKF